MQLQGLGKRRVEADFDGGTLSSDGGGLLLREVESRHGVISGFARCFRDGRNPLWTEFTLEQLVAQRVYGLALGYEDLNDHDDLRRDPLMGVLAEREDPLGQDRHFERDRGKPCAGKSTLNRLELSAAGGSRLKKTPVDPDAVERFLADVFIQSRGRPPAEVVLDCDATDDPLHGDQEGRFFHGYYKEYCYLPLYIFCGGFLLASKLRPSDIDASEGTVEELKRIVGQLRQAWPDVRIVVRGDSGFARDKIMSWCEANGVGYIFGLARNPRLEKELEKELRQAKRRKGRGKKPARLFKEFSYRTRTSWSRERRVVGKAEYTERGANPRFVVSSLPRELIKARRLYETLYCMRGQAENRIKEQQLGLFADRTSTGKMKSNQLRLWFSSVAYLLLHLLRREGLKGTSMAQAECGTIRLKLLKVAVRIVVSVRRVAFSLASGCPYQSLFRQALASLAAPA
jgi:hypothetical protein